MAMRQSLALVATCCTLGVVLAAPVPPEKLRYVDLQPLTNRKLTDNLGTGREGNSLKVLPTGEQTLGGVKFKVGEGLIQLGSKVLDKLPEEVEGIKVGTTFAKLHILHATCFGGGPNKQGSAWFVEDDTPIGEYRVLFEDKSMQTIPVVYGQDVRDWFFVEGEKGVSRGKVVWEGDNEWSKQVGARVRLYLATWENPKPDKKVVSIDYRSKKADTVAAPFCVAMTLEAK
jgi:hypothetical protein